MATINYLIQSAGINAPIYIRLALSTKEINTQNKIQNKTKSFVRKTGFNIDPKRWNTGIKKNGLPKNSQPEEKKTRRHLLNLTKFVNDSLNNDLALGVEINSNWLEKQIDLCFNRVQTTTTTNYLTDWTQKYIESAHQRDNAKQGTGLSKSRINDYKRLKSLILEYEKFSKSRLRIRDIDLAFEKKFIVWMEEINSYAGSYRQRTMGNIKTICTSAKGSEGVIVSKDLKDLTSKKPSNEFIITLSIEELEQIEKVKLTKDALINARLWLLIGCLNLGQRGGDLLSITESNFVKEGGSTFIELEQQKTGAKVVIPILPKTELLLKNGLPYSISLQKFNGYIKEICKIANINTPTKGRLLNPDTKRNEVGIYPKWKLASSHICRRTFATLQYGKISTPLIMSITGHKKESTFLNYCGASSKDYAKMFLDQVKQMEGKKAKQIELPQLKVDSNKSNNNSESN